jgi:hypothetical protein
VIIQQAAPVVYDPAVQTERYADGRVKNAETVNAPAASAPAASAPAANVPASTTVWIKNDNGSQTSVVLRPQGTGFVGPLNEYYSTMPTEEQLKAQYGLKSNVSQANTTKSESVVVWINNGNGSRTPITLQKEGTNYIGPAGEKYVSLPTEEQLKALYGTSPGTSQTDFNVEITRADGTKFVVVLKKEGTEFVGPKGEHYPSMPTEEQLKLIYGR